jgi:cysteine synthase B
MPPIASGATGLVGNTPLVELRALAPELGVRLFAKLESQSPTGSIKDRVALRILEAARERGELAPSDTIVEASTGNTGLAIAMFGRLYGHPVEVCVPESVYPEIGTLLTSYGATVRWVPRGAGITTAIGLAREVADREGAFFADQFGRAENVEVHYEVTAREILDELPQVDAFIAGIGTGGTITGVGRRLKEANPACRVIGIEPRLGVHVQGLTSIEDGFIPPLLDESVLDAKLLVGNRDAVHRAREVMRTEGLSVGISSGAVVCAVRRVAERIGSGNVVLMFADGASKYLSTEVWEAGEADDDDPHGDPIDDVLWW